MGLSLPGSPMFPRSSLLLAAAVLAIAPAAAASQPAPTPASASAPAAPVLARQDAQALLAVLHAAEAQGFGPDEFALGVPEAQLDAADPTVRATAEARLEGAAIDYARAQRGQRLSAFPTEWAIRPPRYDAKADFAAALAQHRVAAWAASLPPSDARYSALVQVYARYREIATLGGWIALAKGPPLKLGATGDRVTALRRRLAVEDPAAPAPVEAKAPTPAAAAPPDTYDRGLADAVSRAQARYGLTPDGAVGPATLQAINVPLETRLGQIRANLERWRWAPRQLPPYRVELNIAAQTLALYDADKPALEMKAIVGKPSKRTPMFQDHIRAIVFNPPWNVPQDIAVKEIWPKIRRDPGYMAREGFVVKPGGGLQQLPGPKCALGTIKFDLSNSFGVYLHDTPAHSLFAGDTRTLSHGCMRLEQPNTLAKRLLQGAPGWNDLRVDGLILLGKTQRIDLPAPTPVFVFYWTVFADARGQTNFRRDAYGWDARLLSLLSTRS